MENYQYKGVLIGLLIGYVMLTALIGWFSRKARSGEDYFLASRRLPSWLLAITFIASWWGGGSAIDLVDHANRDGISTFWIYGVPVLISTALMFLFAPGIRRVATISQPEIMERRYDTPSATMLTIFIIIFMTIGSAIQVIVLAKFFSSFFGMDYALGAVIGTSCVLFYSLFGGFRGVVLTDLLQFCFFLFASVFIFILAYNHSGGFSSMMDVVSTKGMEGYTDFMHNIGDNIAYVLTFGTSWMIQANVWQRISAARTPRSARKMMGISFFVFIPLYLLVTLTGMLSLGLYADGVPQGGVVADMVLRYGSPALGALIFVGLTSAMMSTMDSMFNTGALALTVDIYKRHINPTASPRRVVLVGRLSTLVIALLSLYIGIKVEEVLVISWIGADFIATGAFVPLVLGFLWKGGTSKAAFVTMCYGLVFSTYNLLVAIGVELPVAWEIASAQQALIGISGAFVVFVGVSILTASSEERMRAQGFIDAARILKK